MKKNKIFLTSLILLILVFLWFIGVDKTYIAEGCHACYWQHNFVSYRLFTLPVYTNLIHESHSPIELIAQDLGEPCRHPEFYKSQLKRWWGLIYPTGAYRGSIMSFGSEDDSWYNEELREKARESGTNDPEIGREFYKRVIENHELSYLNDVRNLLQSENE
jgi:hypothetical protein